MLWSRSTTFSTHHTHLTTWANWISWDEFLPQLNTLQGINISLDKAYLKMIFLFPRWDMFISWRVTSLVVSAHLFPILANWIIISRDRGENKKKMKFHHQRENDAIKSKGGWLDGPWMFFFNCDWLIKSSGQTPPPHMACPRYGSKWWHFFFLLIQFVGSPSEHNTKLFIWATKTKKNSVTFHGILVL